jgi:excisionase family DNA binding protein
MDRTAQQQIVVMSPSELRDLIREVVRSEIVGKHDADGEWLTKEQVAELLGYRPRYIGELVRRRGLPCHPIGRKLRFKRSEVRAWAGM